MTIRFILPSWLLGLLIIPTELGAQSISKRGYPEHFIVGSIIAGAVSQYVYIKTKKRNLAWMAGVFASAMAGFFKEVLDSTLLNKMSNWNDLFYTVLGGIAGASVVMPLRKSHKEKPVRI